MIGEKRLSVTKLFLDYPNGVSDLAIDVDKCFKDGDTYEKLAEARGVVPETNQIYNDYLQDLIQGNPLAYLNMKVRTFDALTHKGKKPLLLEEWLEILATIPYSQGALELIEFCNDNDIRVGLNSATIKPYVERIKSDLKRMGLRVQFAEGNTNVLVDGKGFVTDLEQRVPFDDAKWEKHLEICARFGIEPKDLLMIDDGETGLTIAKKGNVIAYTGQHKELNLHALARVDNFREFIKVMSDYRSQLLPKRDKHGG